jgi:hypothetical protein
MNVTPVYAPEIFSTRYDLLERKRILSEMNVIPDMRAYAAGWTQLADEFQSIGLESNAEYCRSRGTHYSQIAGGEYIKLTDGPFAELLEVTEAEQVDAEAQRVIAWVGEDELE